MDTVEVAKSCLSSSLLHCAGYNPITKLQTALKSFIMWCRLMVFVHCGCVAAYLFAACAELLMFLGPPD